MWACERSHRTSQTDSSGIPSDCRGPIVELIQLADIQTVSDVIVMLPTTRDLTAMGETIARVGWNSTVINSKMPRLDLLTGGRGGGKG
jgi:hypothetical protein